MWDTLILLRRRMHFSAWCVANPTTRHKLLRPNAKYTVSQKKRGVEELFAITVNRQLLTDFENSFAVGNSNKLFDICV